MSVCISSHGEFGSHELDDAYTCTLCGVLDEEALTAELRRLRVELSNTYHQRDEARAERNNLATENARLRQQVVFVTGDRDAALASMQRAHDERDEMLTVVEAAEASQVPIRDKDGRTIGTYRKPVTRPTEVFPEFEDEEHVYLSTACRHELHAYCAADTRPDGVAKEPARCKFCAAICVCDCGHPAPADVGHGGDFEPCHCGCGRQVFTADALSRATEEADRMAGEFNRLLEEAHVAHEAGVLTEVLAEPIPGYNDALRDSWRSHAPADQREMVVNISGDGAEIKRVALGELARLGRAGGIQAIADAIGQPINLATAAKVAEAGLLKQEKARADLADREAAPYAEPALTDPAGLDAAIQAASKVLRGWPVADPDWWDGAAADAVRAAAPHIRQAALNEAADEIKEAYEDLDYTDSREDGIEFVLGLLRERAERETT